MDTRINKFLSEVGYCSRRAADKLLEQGRITLNGNVPELGTKVKPDDEVRVDGKLVGEGRRERRWGKEQGRGERRGGRGGRSRSRDRHTRRQKSTASKASKGSDGLPIGWKAVTKEGKTY